MIKPNTPSPTPSTNTHFTNTPFYDPTQITPLQLPKAFHESWIFKVTQPEQQQSLWLQFMILVSQNGFQRLAQINAIFFQRDKNKEIHRTALRLSEDLNRFSFTAPFTLKIGESGINFTPNAGKTWGVLQSKGHTLKWDLDFSNCKHLEFSPLPPIFQKIKLSDHQLVTPAVHIEFNGSFELDGQHITFNAAPGMQSHLSGSRCIYPRYWAHCNSFTNEHGQPVDFIFEGLCLKPLLYNLVSSPPISSFFFYYRGVPYLFHSLWDSLWTHSRRNILGWNFQAERGDLTFKGELKAEHKDFAGFTQEDTNGTILYFANSKLSDLTIHVYRKGKIESTLQALGTASFEVVSKERNPYVPLLL